MERQQGSVVATRMCTRKTAKMAQNHRCAVSFMKMHAQTGWRTRIGCEDMCTVQYKVWGPGAPAVLRWRGACGADQPIWVPVCCINFRPIRILRGAQFFIGIVSRSGRVGSALFRTMGRPAGSRSCAKKEKFAFLVKETGHFGNHLGKLGAYSFVDGHLRLRTPYPV